MAKFLAIYNVFYFRFLSKSKLDWFIQGIAECICDIEAGDYVKISNLKCSPLSLVFFFLAISIRIIVCAFIEMMIYAFEEITWWDAFKNK